jgi:hypothetical protein
MHATPHPEIVENRSEDKDISRQLAPSEEAGHWFGQIEHENENSVKPRAH